MKPENIQPTPLLAEARAKIIWGESASSVRLFLTSNGLPAAEADAKAREFLAERNLEIRKIGLRSTIIGAGLTGGAGFLICLFFIHFRHHNSVPDRHDAEGLGGMVLAGFVGIWLLVKGIIYLVRPQCEEESITEIS